jgi:cob(I)alamin adenosyltransferase
MRKQMTTKIYTGTGDQGKTSLFSGERVFKSYDPVEAYGDVDELSSVLGAICSNLSEEDGMSVELQQIQADLFQVGAWLSISPGSPSEALIKQIPEGRIRAIEQAIDHMVEGLPPLTSFILPGGHITAAWAHIARTVCRRAERRVVQLFADRPEETRRYENVVVYLNRLSDYLFVPARHFNWVHRVQEIPWPT